ncbi:MFS transporter [Streptomyces massasporeus]|uniref:MFS transporter n=1 Tax=Streptomyces massasporeus TaxID=67324 RepID=UPI003647F91B
MRCTRAEPESSNSGSARNHSLFGHTWPIFYFAGEAVTGLTDATRETGSTDGRADFNRLWAADTVSYFGTAVTAVALPILALEQLDASTFEVGLLSAAGVAAWLVFGLSAGAWIERRTKRPLLIACDLIRAAVLLSVPLVAMLDLLTLPYLVSVALVIGVATVFFDIASQTYLPAVIAPQHLVSGNSKLQVSDTAAQTGGPAVGGLMVQLVGAVTSLVVDAVSYLLSALFLARIRGREKVPEPQNSTSVLPQIREGLLFVWSDPIFRPLMLVAAGLNLLGSAFDTLLIPFLINEFGFSPAEVGISLAIGGVGALAGSIVGPFVARRFGAAKALWAAAFIGPPLGLLVPFSQAGLGMVLFAVGLFGREACIAMYSLMARSVRQMASPPHLLARVTATIKFVSWGVLPIGAIAGGTLGQTLGVRPAILVFCVLLLLTSTPLWFVSRKEVQQQIDTAVANAGRDD